MELYAEVSAQIEGIRAHCAALVQFSPQWIELLIAHAELVHSLWRSQPLPAAERAAGVADAMRQHGRCVQALSRRCRGHLALRADSAPPSV